MNQNVAVTEKEVFWRNKMWFLGAIGFFFDAMDVGIFSFAVAAIAKEWVLNTTMTGILGSVNSLGMAVGAVLSGWLADRFGRKWVFSGSLLLFSVGSIISAFVPSAFAPGFMILLIIRFFIGLGLGGELPVASTYVSETAPIKDRGRAVVLAESFWALGWMVAAIVAFYLIPEYGWRIGFIFAGIPAFYALYLRRQLKESPKFVKTAYQQTSIKDLFHVKLRKGTITASVLWFTINFAYYGMFLWLPSILFLNGFSIVKSFQYVMFMALAQLPGYFASAWLIERIGRRWVLAIFMAGTGISALGFGWSDSVTFILTFGALLNFFNLGAWGALYAYTPEIFPTSIRARGAGFAAGFGRIGSVIAPYLVGVFLSTGAIFTLFFIMLMIGVVTVLSIGPETKGKEIA